MAFSLVYKYIITIHVNYLFFHLDNQYQTLVENQKQQLTDNNILFGDLKQKYITASLHLSRDEHDNKAYIE